MSLYGGEVNAAKAFDDLKALWGGAGARLEGTLAASGAKYQPAIAANLSKVAAKFSPDFLGDFLNTTANSAPAAASPDGARALELSTPPAYVYLIAGLLVLWGLYNVRR